jgi:hypothetical protein
LELGLAATATPQRIQTRFGGLGVVPDIPTFVFFRIMSTRIDA